MRIQFLHPLPPMTACLASPLSPPMLWLLIDASGRGKVYLADPGSKHHFSYWHRYKWTPFTPRGNTLAQKPLESLDNTARHWQLPQCPSPPPPMGCRACDNTTTQIPLPILPPLQTVPWQHRTVPCFYFCFTIKDVTSLPSVVTFYPKAWQRTPFPFYAVTKLPPT